MMRGKRFPQGRLSRLRNVRGLHKNKIPGADGQWAVLADGKGSGWWGAAISHLDQAKVFIRAMKEMGVKFALDDFGSGVSSFGYLRSLLVDYLKIDGGLVRNIVHERCDRTIVDLVNQVAHMMNMHTIAEFVEDDKTIEQLQLLKVDYAHGYALGEITKLEEV